MTKHPLLFLNILTFSCLIMSCKGDDDNTRVDALLEWREWLEASSPPAETLELPMYIPCDTLLSPEACDYNYFMIESFVIDDDRVYLADGRTSLLLAFDLNGDLLWKTGGEGEGPGLFSGIGDIAVRNDTLAVCNHGVGRIDYFNCDNGDWLYSTSVLWPYSVDYLENGNLVITSLSESNLVSIISPDGDVLSSFGAWNGSGDEVFYSMFSSSNRNLHSTLINDSTLAVNSYFYNWCQVFNLNSGQLTCSFRRELPYPEKEFEIKDGGVVGNIYTNDIATFDGMIAILHRPIEQSWDIPSRYDGVNYYEVDFSMVDVWSINGEYLGSFAFPRKVGLIYWYNDTLYGATDETGEVIQYSAISLE